MNDIQIINWLLDGDISIQYQVYRDLLGDDRKDLQNRISEQGWARQFLSKRNPNGYWGAGFYQPKWISTHYTLLDLRYLNLSRNYEKVKETIDLVLDTGKADDGGIKLGPSTAHRSDVCVNGMFLNYASYFKSSENKLHSIVDSILNEMMPDGGFNCRTTRSGATHSSLHTTISVLEGFVEFQKSGSQYRKVEIKKARKSAEEFILLHRLYLSDHTGEIIHKNFLKLSYPSRWRYDILRALDYFRYAGSNWDERMENALNVIDKKRNKNNTWNLQAAHPGKVHFLMEKAGKPSRWNTLRALRVLSHFKKGKKTLNHQN
ncbi:hypothetical protein [Gracilimonas mengyeensis]|uniref:Prenyltransferase and squalene oxidase repeat-containing protein n=1 Tax=Gracilimonas mengyeensis TaxID=1302730 RepID=A0A521AXZ9_9BACT|nr:hypothetical protein [Gracilimonas mengyeensis]SMO39621.1 hypothetical protein SAMN06265219_101412 [Gracilimonas mengyeensis]